MQDDKPAAEMTVGPNEYRCAACGQVFAKGRSDEETEAELAELFPGFEKEECGIVCDDCFKAMGF